MKEKRKKLSALSTEFTSITIRHGQREEIRSERGKQLNLTDTERERKGGKNEKE